MLSTHTQPRWPDIDAFDTHNHDGLGEGWGLFTADALEKDDFIYEYMGKPTAPLAAHANSSLRSPDLSIVATQEPRTLPVVPPLCVSMPWLPLADSCADCSHIHGGLMQAR
jgi:hypothetical protein